MRASTIALLSMTAACGGSSTPGPEPLRNQGDPINTVPRLPLSGPHRSIDAVAAPDELEPRARVAAAASSSPFLAVEVYQYGEVIAAAYALCRIAIRLADGWYVSEPFGCGDADNRSSSRMSFDEVAVADGSVVIRYRETFDAWNMDNDGVHQWAYTQHEIQCGLETGGTPACSQPVAGESEGGSERMDGN